MPFNIGAPELIIILIIALIVLGPGKLPDVASSLGKSVREFRKAATDINDAGKLDQPAANASATQAATTPAASEPASATAAPIAAAESAPAQAAPAPGGEAPAAPAEPAKDASAG